MITKEEIIIKVPSDLAQAYRNFTEVEREQINSKIADLLEVQLNTRRKEAIERLKKTISQASQEAQARCLTPEILELILKDNK